MKQIKSTRFVPILSALAAFQAWHCHAQTIYSVNSNGVIASIDPVAGTQTILANTAATYNAAAYDPENDILYFSAEGANPDNLWGYNTVTDSIFQVGSVPGGFGDLRGATFHDSIYYAMAYNSNDLLAFSLPTSANTGTITPTVSQLNFAGSSWAGSLMGDIVVDGDGQFWVSGQNGSGTQSGLFQYASLADAMAGNAPLQFLQGVEYNYAGLAYDSASDTLYGSRANGNLYSIDQTTAAATLVQTNISSLGAELVDMAGISQAVPEPTLSVLLSLGVGYFGFRRRRV